MHGHDAVRLPPELAHGDADPFGHVTSFRSINNVNCRSERSVIIVNVSTGTAGDRVALVNLSAERVVAEALSLVNEGGLESLTMRRLADRLNAHLPTIYRLVDGKDALMDEMAETILANALSTFPPDDADWTAQVKGLAAGLRSALLAQRDGARIVGGNYAAKRANLTYTDTLVGCMQAIGLAGEYALWASGAVFCFVLGEVLEQQGASGGELENLEGVLHAGNYPHLASSPVEHLLDFDARFEFGLNLLISGIRSGLDSPE
ncbi:TetR/AcrR family transcriptional regulator C-terminal domain-containing protein [Mycolicibacterium goodii]|nr:TetR/AcrR family transcriptional regulator C-terminal domain-containing protein [Mycolicibacterium goodii]PJK18787.1 TetR family transcriptional regulator [Mycolicibacterium goodii]